MPLSPDSPLAEESSRLTRANTEKDIGGDPVRRGRSRIISEAESLGLAGSPPSRVVPEWASKSAPDLDAARSGAAAESSHPWWWLRFCCAVEAPPSGATAPRAGARRT
jgi:hypothetical protein